MKKIEAWKTTDGKIWETEEAAGIHQKRLNIIKEMEVLYYRGMIECGEHLVDFLDSYKKQILDYYGAEEK